MTMATGTDANDDAARAALASAMMRRQAALSIRVAAIFLILIFGLPLVNWLLPQIALAPVGGFTLTWLLLGILFYPITWLLSGYFIRESDRIEAQIAAEYPHAEGKGTAR